MANKAKTQSSSEQMKLLSSASQTATSRAGDGNNTTAQDNKTMETKTMNTRQAEIDKFYEATGYRLEERADGWLYYDGDLYLRDADVKELEKIEVGGWLDLRNTPVKTLEQVKVGGTIDLTYTSIKRLKQVESGRQIHFKDVRISRMDLEQKVDEQANN